MEVWPAVGEVEGLIDLVVGEAKTVRPHDAEVAQEKYFAVTIDGRLNGLAADLAMPDRHVPHRKCAEGGRTSSSVILSGSRPGATDTVSWG